MLFSVIVPEHNSAEFMRKGLDSIAAQSFRDYELIIVCDSCTDNTAEIAKSYDKRVPELTVLEVEYGRCGLTRNRGLDIARGEYVIFMDDDDWFASEYAFELIAGRTAKRPDVVALGFMARDFCEQPGLQCFYSHTANLSPTMRNWAAPWTKAWRRDFIGGHRFPDIKHSDDLPFTREMMEIAESMEVIYAPLYYYNYMRVGSIQHKLKTGELEPIE